MPTGLEDALNQDLLACKRAIENDLFEDANIYANRLMSNALLASDKRLMIPGFLLKEVALDLAAIQRRKGPLADAKSVSLKFVSRLSNKLASKKLDLPALWSDFSGYFSEAHEHLMNDEERESYKANPKFSRQVVEWAVAFLGKRKELLLRSNSNLIKGVLIETSRVLRVHGSDEGGLIAESLMIALDRLYDYIRYAYGDDEVAFREQVQGTTIPWTDRVAEILSQLPKGLDVDAASELLGELAIRWREFYVEFMDLPRLVTAEQRVVEVPAEAKEKITETIVSALEKEVKKG